MALAAALSACSSQSEDPPAGAAPDARVRAVCARGEGFITDGSAGIEPAAAGDARGIRSLRWESHGECERFVIDLVSDDGSSAASPGEVRADVLRSNGVVRVRLPGVHEVGAAAADTAVSGELAAAAYVVRSENDRSLFVDVHVTRAFEARVTTLPAPARVVVDLRPGGGAVAPPAARGERVVLLEPRSGDTAYPLRLAGYARQFEANVVARIVQDGREVARTFTTATDWLETWGSYTMQFDSGPTGAIELHVGEYSARDGAWNGVVVQLNAR